MADRAVAQALVLEAPRRLVVRELPLPNLGDDDALVRVAACGLCGTDHEQYTGELAGGFAFVPGHETVGTIDAIGPQAAQRWGVAAGDRVAVGGTSNAVKRRRVAAERSPQSSGALVRARPILTNKPCRGRTCRLLPHMLWTVTHVTSAPARR
jgi:threonine dehydrogenase-like Zn-dependent dehydrogenase